MNGINGTIESNPVNQAIMFSICVAIHYIYTTYILI